MVNKFRVPAVIACWLVVSLTDLAVGSESWKAGVAKTAITPQQPMWMSGYAARNRPAEGTLHDLWAKALVLEDPAGSRVVLVTLDLIGMHRDVAAEICQRLQEKHKLERRHIALATSHTHTGPVVGKNLFSMYFLDESQQQQVRDYATFLVDRVVEVVGEAWKNMEPATLKHGMGRATFAVNRRNNREGEVPRLRETGELRGPVDHELPVLAVYDSQQQLKSIVFGYACHATVLNFYQWSGDWPGFAQIELERRHPQAVALFWAGCGADQNPLPRRTVELAAGYGEQIADAVDKTLAGQPRAVAGNLQSAYQEVPLAFDTLPDQEQLRKDAESTNRYVASRARMLLDQWRRDGGLAEQYRYPVQFWKLGNDIHFVILGGEVVVDYSVRLKTESEQETVWVAAYANDVMAYIPSRRVLLEGGYEGASSMIYYGQPTTWAADIEDRIHRAVRDVIARAKP